MGGPLAGTRIIELAGIRYDPELVAIWRGIDERRWASVAHEAQARAA